MHFKWNRFIEYIENKTRLWQQEKRWITSSMRFPMMRSRRHIKISALFNMLLQSCFLKEHHSDVAIARPSVDSWNSDSLKPRLKSLGDLMHHLSLCSTNYPNWYQHLKVEKKNFEYIFHKLISHFTPMRLSKSEDFCRRVVLATELIEIWKLRLEYLLSIEVYEPMNRESGLRERFAK